MTVINLFGSASSSSPLGSILKGSCEDVHPNSPKSITILFKTFEMVGFGGAPADIAFVLYLARCAVTLEKVLLDPHLPFDEGKPSKQNHLSR